MSLQSFGITMLAALATAVPVQAASTASCGSDDTKQTLFSLIARDLGQTIARNADEMGKGLQGINLHLVHVVTTDHDDTGQHNLCSGSLAFTIPAELFQLSHTVASGATISLTGTLMNDWMANASLMNGQFNSKDPHVMRALMIRVGQLQSASLELPITYKSEMTDDGTEHIVSLQTEIGPVQAPVLATMLWQDNPDLARSVKNDVAIEAQAPQSPRFGGIDPAWAKRPAVSTLSHDPGTQKANYLTARATLIEVQARIAASMITNVDKEIADFRAQNPDIKPVADADYSDAMSMMSVPPIDNAKIRLQKSVQLRGLMNKRANLEKPGFIQAVGYFSINHGMTRVENGALVCADGKPQPCYDAMNDFAMWYGMATDTDKPAYVAASEAFIDQRNNLGGRGADALEKSLREQRLLEKSGGRE